MIRLVPDGKRRILGIPPLVGSIIAWPTFLVWWAAVDGGISLGDAIDSAPAVFLYSVPLSFVGMWTVGAGVYVLLSRFGHATALNLGLVGAAFGGLIVWVVAPRLPWLWLTGVFVGAMIGVVTRATDLRLLRSGSRHSASDPGAPAT